MTPDEMVYIAAWMFGVTVALAAAAGLVLILF